MPTFVPGTLYSDLLVGQKEDISEDLRTLVPEQTPFLNSIGYGRGVAKNATHQYLDDAYIPRRGLLSGAHSAATTTFVATTACAKPGQRIQCQGEVILLGASLDNLTFTGCLRGQGTAAAAIHASGVPFTILGKAEVQGVAAGSADVSYEPRTVTNYVQQFMKVCDVPDITMGAQRYGRPGNAYDDDVLVKMRDMKIEIEESALHGVAVLGVGSTAVSGWMGGFYERVVGTHTTAMGGISIRQEDLKTAVEGIGAFFDPQINVNAIMLCSLHQSLVFDSWVEAHVVVAPGDPLVALYGVNCRRLRVGPMLIDVLVGPRMYDEAYLYQPQFIDLPFYPSMTPKHEALARDGLRQRGMISAAPTMEVRCPEAHHIFTGVAVS